MAWGKPDPDGAAGAAPLIARVADDDATLRSLHIMAQRALGPDDWQVRGRMGNDKARGSGLAPRLLRRAFACGWSLHALALTSGCRV